MTMHDKGTRAAWAAALAAIERVRACVSDDAEPHPHIFDALDGLYRLEESCRRRLGDDAYFSVRNGDPRGRILGGLVYVRGLATHQTVLASTFIDVFPSDTLYPGEDVFPGRQWRWKTFESLPPPGKQERWERDEMYRRHLEQQDLLRTLGEAQGFLLTVSGRAAQRPST
ncbi:MAG: hypothetical protein HYU28_05485 [Actinobacteria bacterium]|nr:hypothetical protein [Actinomycetota bacterium]